MIKPEQHAYAMTLQHGMVTTARHLLSTASGSIDLCHSHAKVFQQIPDYYLTSDFTALDNYN